jgi:hypothetical protein
MPESPASGAGDPLELPEPLDDPLSAPELVEPLASDPLELPDTTSPHLSGAPDASICVGEAPSAAPASIGAIGAAWSPQDRSKYARQENRTARMVSAQVHEPVRAAAGRVKNR